MPDAFQIDKQSPVPLLTNGAGKPARREETQLLATGSLHLIQYLIIFNDVPNHDRRSVQNGLTHGAATLHHGQKFCDFLLRSFRLDMNRHPDSLKTGAYARVAFEETHDIEIALDIYPVLLQIDLERFGKKRAVIHWHAPRAHRRVSTGLIPVSVPPRFLGSSATALNPLTSLSTLIPVSFKTEVALKVCKFMIPPQSLLTCMLRPPI